MEEMNAYDPEAMGKKLIALRDERPRTLMARKMGIATSTLQSYEEGRRVPRDDKKVQIANFYGKTVQEIFYAH